MIHQSVFEEKIVDYIDGRLSAFERKQLEEYLQENPQEKELEQDFKTLMKVSREVGEEHMPSDLHLQAKEALLNRLRSVDVATERVDSKNKYPAATAKSAPPLWEFFRRNIFGWRPIFGMVFVAALLIDLMFLGGATSGIVHSFAEEILQPLISKVRTVQTRLHVSVQRVGKNGRLEDVSDTIMVDNGVIYMTEGASAPRIHNPEYLPTVRRPTDIGMLQMKQLSDTTIHISETVVIDDNAASSDVDMFEIIAELAAKEMGFSLPTANPNPFKNETDIEFSLTEESKVELSIYNTDYEGRRIWQINMETLSPGTHIVLWDGKDDSGNALPSGTYRIYLWVNQYSMSKNVVIER